MTATNLNKLPSLDFFFQKDVINIKEHPDARVRLKVNRRRSTIFDFSKLRMPVRLELKHYLQEILSKDIAYNALNSYLTPLQHFIDFLNIESATHDSLSLRKFSLELKKDFKNYLESIGVAVTHSRHGQSTSLKIYERAYLFVMDLYNGSNPFDKDIWRLEQMGIESSRLIESKKMKTISFHTIPNELNRKLAKKYMKYLMTTTDKAISTIISKLKYIRELLTFLEDKPITQMSRSDVERFIQKIDKKDLKNVTFNDSIFVDSKFVEYLIVSGDLTMNHFYSNDIKSVNREHSYKAVDESVIKQIFSVLNEIPMQEACMFLLIYSTGMRVSEACSIKLNKLFDNENGYLFAFIQKKCVRKL